MANRRISSEQFLEMLNDDCVINTVLMIDEAHFHLSRYINNKIIATGHLKIHKSSISVLSTAKDWLSGVNRIFWSSWTLFLWRQPRCSRYCDIRALCGNATQLLWTRVTSSWDRSLISMVSAKRSNSPHSKGISVLREMFPQRHFPWWRCSMAGTFAWSLRLWLLLTGYLKSSFFSSLNLEPYRN